MYLFQGEEEDKEEWRNAESPVLIDVVEYETDEQGNEIANPVESIKRKTVIYKPRDRSGQNSLSLLCRRFLMLLLCAPVYQKYKINMKNILYLDRGPCVVRCCKYASDPERRC